MTTHAHTGEIEWQEAAGAAPPRRGVIALAWALTLLVWALSVAAFVFLVLDRASSGSEFLPDALFLAVPCAYAAVGGLVATRRRGNNVGWICLAIGLIWAISGFGDAVTGWTHHKGHLGVVEWAGLTGSFWLPAVGLIGQLALRLPNGHLLSSRCVSWARSLRWCCAIAAPGAWSGSSSAGSRSGDWSSSASGSPSSASSG
jgi:hypothetical protein